MKEIKFRAILNQEALSNPIYKGEQRVVEFTLEDLLRGRITFAYPEHWKFLRWTGLKDKNGKEIYEGDVVKYKDFSEGAYFTIGGRDIQPRRCSVVEMEHLFDGIHLQGAGFIRSQKEAEQKLEVIGDVYQNPELLRP